MVDAVIDVIVGAVFDDAKCEREIVGDGIEGVGPQTNAQTDEIKGKERKRIIQCRIKLKV